MTVPLAPPAVSPFRTLLVLLVIVHFSHQQDIRQPWDGSRLIPINVVDEHRNNSSQVHNYSLSPGTIRKNGPEQIYDNEEKDAGVEEDENYDDYLAETEDEDPELIRNRETVAVQRVSKEKIINETTIFHSGETNGTDYPDYNYYDYDYDNDTNFDNKDQVEENVKSEPPVEIEYVEDSSLSKPDVEETAEKVVPVEEIPEKQVSEEELSEKEVSEKEISEKEVSEKEVPVKEISQEEAPEKEVSSKEDEDYLIMNTEETPLDEEAESSNSSILIGEAIVSVVTTKSVVNGTFSVPVTPLPHTTEQLEPQQSTSPQPESSSASAVTENTLQVTTEDSEKVLASVQTVRSISGARFLPFPGIDPLQYGHETTAKTILNPATTDKSTESIIEKLDRVQSELSSGIIATNFGSGNNIQVDLNSAKAGQKGGTTLKTPVVSKFIPKRYSDRRLIKTATSTPQIEPEKSQVTESVKKAKLGNLAVAAPDISAFLPPGYKLKPESTTEKSLLSEILNKSKVDLSAFLPPGYRAEEAQKTVQSTSEKPATSTSSPTTLTTQKAVKAIASLQDLFVKSQVDISALLPKDYREKIPSTTATAVAPTTATEKSTNSSSKKVASIQDLFAKSEVDLTGLLPKDFKPRFKTPEIKTKLSKDNKQDEPPLAGSSTEVSPTTKAGIKLVFPSRPGGRKNIVKATTASAPKSDGSGQVTPKIQKGWPTRATTEFTGWPKPSTTPISIEKLLEAARTATVSSLSNTSVEVSTSTVSSTSTTTTTTTTPRPTTPGICDDECKVAGTIRLVGTATWVPELLDRNTREWQDLADRIEKEMNFVLSKSPTLSKWFKEVQIDSFSQGSILVDYFIELVDVKKPVNTQELKGIFHDSLNIYNSNRYNDTSSTNATVKLGPFTIDPKSTDFIVIPKVSIPLHVEDDKLIPQWVIAVIVIGVGGLLFIIVFGVSVLANRHNGSKLKPSMSTMYSEEISKHNNMHSSRSILQMQQRSSDYSKSNSNTIWNDPSPPWGHDKVYESNSNKALMDVPISFNGDKRCNGYDSWRSEWNGYYHNPSQTYSRYAGYDSTINLSSHHGNHDNHDHHDYGNHGHHDYDTNFSDF